MEITKIIKELREKYVSENIAKNYYEINNGLCEDFALECIALLGGYDDQNELYELQNESFMMGLDGSEEGGDIWDNELLQKHWSISPPCELEWEDVNEINFGRHVWIHYKGLHYDAECSKGMVNFFELPIFKRYIINYCKSNNIVVKEEVEVN